MAEILSGDWNKTPCQEKPWRCAPRNVRLVAWDADDTAWTLEPHVIASNVCGPFKKLDDDTVEGQECSYHPAPTASKVTKKGALKSYPHEVVYNYGTSKWDDVSAKPKKGETLEQITNALMQALSPSQQKVVGLYTEGRIKFGDLTKSERNIVNALEREKSRAPKAPAPQLALPEPKTVIEGGWEELPVSGSTSEQAIQDLVNQLRRAREEFQSGEIGRQLLLEEERDIAGKIIAVEPLEGGKEAWRAILARATRELESVGRASMSRKITVKLLPTFRQTVEELERRKIKMAIVSLNTPGSVKAIMEAFGFADKFAEIKDTWRNKGDVLAEMMEKLKVSPNETIFVDNMRSHVDDANRQCAMGLVIGKGKDVERPIEVLDFVES